jgi:predicted DNA-binding protein (UPF0251 family)
MSATVRTIIGMYSTIACRDKIDDMLVQKIDIDRAMGILSANRTLTDMERQVLVVASTGCSRNSGAQQLGIYRRRFVRLLNSACKKIAEYLGEEYSDNRILELAEVKIGRRLTEEEHRKVLETLMRFGGNYSKESVI